MSKTPIYNAVKRIAAQNGVRFCMPGHKGKDAFLSDINKFDITELPGADNLYKPEGIISKAQESYARFIGAKKSFFLVNGSSCGVQAAVLSVLSPGDEIITVRDFHLSAPHAFTLAGALPHFVYPKRYGLTDFAPVSAVEIENAVKKYPNSKAVYLTYPNYCGLCADLKSICAAAHNAGMKVICDAAHSAAFDYSLKLPLSPAEAGCDIWAASLHKTLPAMNQCAVLCVGKNSGIDTSLVQSRLNLIQTTSPSYILLASSEYAFNYMKEYGEAALSKTIETVKYYSEKISGLSGYECLTYEIARKLGAFDYDILKLLINVSERGLTGFEAADQLARMGIYVESADLERILLICTVMDEESDFKRLYEALAEIRTTAGGTYEPDIFKIDAIINNELKMSIREAVFAPRERIEFERSAGRISSVTAGAYPPGVPVLLPGQEITQNIINYFKELKKIGYEIFGADKNISVVK